MRSKLLKQFIAETLSTIKESEIYVDEKGYAHDDEGNTWFAGKQRPGFHGSIRKASERFPAKTIDYDDPMFVEKETQKNIQNAKRLLFKEIIDELSKSFPEDSFIASLASQVARGKTLSEKQLQILIKIAKSKNVDAKIIGYLEQK